MNNIPSDLFFDIGISQLNKFGEELCGDSIISNKMHGTHTLILSDGLGSGVKANILSTLTSRIISGMLTNGCQLKEVVETLIDTLPTCSYRKLAYSTFSIVQLEKKGEVKLVEYDNPPAIYFRDGKVQGVRYIEKNIKGKQIKISKFCVKEGDLLVLMSDGEVHAGICGTCNLGWNWEKISNFVERISGKSMSASEIAFELTNTANKLYDEKPGDDTSVAVIRIRKKKIANVMVGAPSSKDMDEKVVNDFLSRKGRKIVCGGTTGNIVSRILDQDIVVDIESMQDGIPPVGMMNGIDLCTEGIITISNTLKMLQGNVSYKKLEVKRTGVTLLVKELLQADEINFYLGKAVNPAHQSPNMPLEFGLKLQIMNKIADILKKKNKVIEINSN